MTIKVWTHEMLALEALELPEGRLAADFGVLVQVSVTPKDTVEAARAIVSFCQDTGAAFEAFSQAEVIVDAQKTGLVFQDCGVFTLI